MRRRQGSFQRLRQYDWDAIAGVIAAAVALVLHLLHVVDVEVLTTITLVVLALLLLRDLRREEHDERMEALSASTERELARLRLALTPPDVVLIGPRDLRRASERFASEAVGDMVWFNVCLLMFRPQALFDALLRPAIENARVQSIQFVLDPAERERWEADVLPKVRACRGAEKVREPRWRPLDQSISFILTDVADHRAEAHVSFWGEPFMSRTTGHDIPRYVFHVQAHSELIPQLIAMERSHRA